MTDAGGRRLTRRHALVAALACVALILAVTGRLTSCAGCDYGLFGIPLFVLGSIYYLVLGLLALLGVSLKLIGWLSLPGVALQAGLARFLIGAGVPCAPCLGAAASLFLLSVIALWPDRYWKLAPGMVALFGVALLPLWSARLVNSEAVTSLPPFARSSDFEPAPGKGTLVVAYMREGCKYCRAFETTYEPRLARDFGPAVTVRRIDARDRKGLNNVPSFMLRLPDGSLHLVSGLPRYEDLASRIRAN